MPMSVDRNALIIKQFEEILKTYNVLGQQLQQIATLLSPMAVGQQKLDPVINVEVLSEAEAKIMQANRMMPPTIKEILQ